MQRTPPPPSTFPRASEALAPSAFAVGQRVRVDWGDGETHTARVVELHTEFCGERPVLLKVRVEYNDGQRLWHEPHKLPIRPLDGTEGDHDTDEGSSERGGNSAADEAVCGPWQKLALRCCYSHRRLVDPARGSACLHPPTCNHDALALYIAQSRSKACPVAGCAQLLVRRDAIVRDDAIRRAIAKLPASAEACWLRGTEVRLEAPVSAWLTAAAGGAGGKRRCGVSTEGAAGSSSDRVHPLVGTRAKASRVMSTIDEAEVVVVPEENSEEEEAAATGERASAVMALEEGKEEVAVEDDEEDEEEFETCDMFGCTRPRLHRGPCSWIATLPAARQRLR